MIITHSYCCCYYFTVLILFMFIIIIIVTHNYTERLRTPPVRPRGLAPDVIFTIGAIITIVSNITIIIIISSSSSTITITTTITITSTCTVCSDICASYCIARPRAGC